MTVRTRVPSRRSPYLPLLSPILTAPPGHVYLFVAVHEHPVANMTQSAHHIVLVITNPKRASRSRSDEVGIRRKKR